MRLKKWFKVYNAYEAITNRKSKYPALIGKNASSESLKEKKCKGTCGINVLLLRLEH